MTTKYAIGATRSRNGHELVERSILRDGAARTFLECQRCGNLGEGPSAFRTPCLGDAR